jgi:exosortase N
MQSFSARAVSFSKLQLIAIGLLLIYAAVWIAVLRDYLSPTSLSFILAAWTLPFTLRKEGGGPFAVWIFLALVWISLSLLVPVKTLLYFALGGSLFVLLPALSYRPTFLSIAVWVVAAPAFQYLTNVFSFPIRLQLTTWASQLLGLWIPGIEVRGNVIYYGSNEFSVDPECMGLNMLVTSLLLGIMTLGYFQMKQKRTVGWGWVLLFLLGVLGCNVVSNLLRIVLLVQFSVWPGTLMHEGVGLACLALYVLVPSVLGSRLLVSRVGVAACEEKASAPKPQKLLLHYLLAALVTLSAVRVMTVDTYAPFQSAGAIRVEGYRSSVFAPGILKLENDHALIYVKYVRGFYDTDHNPSLCWKGSGYEFQQVEQKTFAGVPVYTALLVNRPEKLYTAWWYGNGTTNTIDQFRWRYDRLKGSPNYAVINVTAASPAFLQAEVEQVIGKKALDRLFEKPVKTTNYAK